MEDKEMVAIYNGERESKLSWKTVLQQLKSKGLKPRTKVVSERWGSGVLGYFRRGISWM